MIDFKYDNQGNLMAIDNDGVVIGNVVTMGDTLDDDKGAEHGKGNSGSRGNI